MSYNDFSSRPVSGTDSAVDAGLQSYMRLVFNTMGIGLVVTGLVAFGLANTPALFAAIFGSPLKWVALLAPVAFLWIGFSPRNIMRTDGSIVRMDSRIMRMDSARARMLFYVFSGTMGISLAALFHIFSGESIARAFFISAAMFAGTSLYGYTTKRDLTGMGSFLMMGLFGLIFASVINLFIGSSAVQFVVSVIGVFVFTGLTAFDVQRLKEIYYTGAGYADANAKMAVLGALSLYMNFINLFQMILQFTGSQRD